MPEIDAEAVERRQALAEQKQIKLREGEEAMAEHLAGIDQERQKTERLRAARLAMEAGGIGTPPKPKRAKKAATKAK